MTINPITSGLNPSSLEVRFRELEAQVAELKHACRLSVFALGMAIGEGVLKQDTEFYLQQALDECRAALAKMRATREAGR